MSAFVIQYATIFYPMAANFQIDRFTIHEKFKLLVIFGLQHQNINSKVFAFKLKICEHKNIPFKTSIKISSRMISQIKLKFYCWKRTMKKIMWNKRNQTGKSSTKLKKNQIFYNANVEYLGVNCKLILIRNKDLVKNVLCRFL